MTTTIEAQTLTRVGDKLAFVFDAATLERLGITAETPLQVSTEGGSLRISPRPVAAGGLTNEVFGAAMQAVMTQYDQTFRDLAK